MLMHAQEVKERKKEIGNHEIEEIKETVDIDPKTYCKLGHFHLLLEDYAKGILFKLNSCY